MIGDVDVFQAIVAEHEIQNISCAAQDPDDLCSFAYITKDLKSSYHFCHVFTTVEVVSVGLYVLYNSYDVRIHSTNDCSSLRRRRMRSFWLWDRLSRWPIRWLYRRRSPGGTVPMQVQSQKTQKPRAVDPRLNPVTVHAARQWVWHINCLQKYMMLWNKDEAKGWIHPKMNFLPSFTLSVEQKEITGNLSEMFCWL